MISRSDLKEALEAGQDLLGKVPEPIQYTRTRDKTRDDMAKLMVGFYSRAADIYRAVIVLANRGTLTEAVTLARSLYEIALMARYISLEPKERMSAYKASAGIGFHKLYRSLRELRPSDLVVKATEENPDFGRAEKAWKNAAARKEWPNRAQIAGIVDRELKDRGMLGDDTVESTTAYRWAYRLLYHEFSEVSHTGASLVRRLFRVRRETPTADVDFRNPQIDDEMRYLVWSIIPFLSTVVELATDAVGINMKEDIAETSQRHLQSGMGNPPQT